jgi:predicted small metal-binding protein
MKQITCAKLGGSETCDFVVKGNTAQEVIEVGWKHLQEAHAEIAQRIMSQPKEQNDKWMEDFKNNVFPPLAEA